MRISVFIVFGALLCGAATLTAGAADDVQSAPATVAPPTEETPPAVEKYEETLVVERKEDLIYSVDRTPQRTFDTSRAVTVVTGEEIRRANPTGLARILEEQVGLVVSSRPSGGSAIMRGLTGKQVMILIDGVKVNNATWGGSEREYLNLIAVDQIDRVEIVRGVVSVLGTESLGGVINIITKKSGPSGDRFGGSIGARFASGGSSLATPLQVYASTARVRLHGGVSGMRTGDLRAGGGAEQQLGFKQTDAYINGDIRLTADKTIGFGYQSVEQGDVEVGLEGFDAERELKMATLSYHDLSSRPWADSLRAVIYWNYQQQEFDITFDGATTHTFDGDRVGGANLELGKFIGSHHLVYGIDYSQDQVESWVYGPDFTTGQMARQRGIVMDGAGYSMLGVYLQDRFHPWKWLTVVAGARYGKFGTSGEESTFLGELNLENSQSDVTGALNLIAHVNPHLNLIANAFRGFRAPNIDDTSRLAFVFSPNGRFGVQIPNAGVEAEHVMSYEAGVKYERQGLSASAFAYRNELSGLLSVRTVTYLDFDGNGQQDPTDWDILQNLNVGEATIEGFELAGRYAMSRGVSVWAHYAKSHAVDTITGDPLAFVPGGAGAAGVLYTPVAARAPWVELVWRHQQAQRHLHPSEMGNPEYAQAFNLLHLRGGVNVTDAIAATVGVENAFDEEYHEMGVYTFATGRQFVLGLTYNF